MLVLFTCLAYSNTLADLEPPFMVEKNKKIGYWEYGGSAIVEQDIIMLAPPVQFNKGYIWTNVEIPTTDWSIEYDFRIIEGTGGGGIGIWFVDRYGADGVLHGGPTEFKGIGILLTVKTDESYKRSLLISVIQSHGLETFKEPPNPIHTIPIPDQSHMKFNVSFTQGKIVLYVDPRGKGNIEEIYNKPVIVDIRDCYIGLTAQSDIYTARFNLYSAKFELSTEQEQRKISIGNNAGSGHYSPKNIQRLRNPIFQKTLLYMNLLSLNATVEPNCTDILDIVDEIYNVNDGVASFKFLNEFWLQTIGPYAEKWHKRTIKTVNTVKQAKEVLESATNYTQLLMNELGTTIKEAAAKASSKIDNFADIIKESEEEIDIVPQHQKVMEISLEGTPLDYQFILLAFSFLELVLTMIIMILMQQPRFQDMMH